MASHRDVRVLSLLLLIAGAGCLLVALVFNAFGLDEEPGFVRRQLVLASIGFAAGLAGVLTSETMRGRLRGWLSAAPAARPGQCLWVAVWIGILTGVAEVGHVLLRKLLFGILAIQPPELVWMAPFSYVVLFFPVGLGLAALVRWMPSAFRLPVVAFVLIALAAWSQCLFYPFHRVAAAITAVGLAAWAARFVAGRPRGALRTARLTLPWLAGIIVAVAVAMAMAPPVIETRVTAALPPARDDAPNVLLIVLDTVRADHVGFGGYQRDTTPHLDALADRGVVFDWAVSTSPWTLPAHASMFTGRYAHELSADWLAPLDDAYPTLAETLAGHGYLTGGFSGNTRYCLREQGIARGFLHYEDFYVEPEVVAFSTIGGRLIASRVLGHRFNEVARNDAMEVTDRALDWLSRAEGRPFFAFVNYFDAHAYYLPPPGFDADYGLPSPLLRQWYQRSDWSDSEVAGFVDAYDGCIRFIDSQVQRLVDHLRDRGLLDDTIVIVTSDHGEQFGEHGLFEHGNSLYRQLLHVPLVLAYPPVSAAAGVRVSDFVTLRDLPATILDLAQLPPALPGHSLARVWEAGSPSRGGEFSPILADVRGGIRRPPREPISKGDMFSVIADGLQLIRNGDGREEVYDFCADPRAEHDIRNAVEGRGSLARLREMLPR